MLLFKALFVVASFLAVTNTTPVTSNRIALAERDMTLARMLSSIVTYQINKALISPLYTVAERDGYDKLVCLDVRKAHLQSFGGSSRHNMHLPQETTLHL